MKMRLITLLAALLLPVIGSAQRSHITQRTPIMRVDVMQFSGRRMLTRTRLVVDRSRQPIALPRAGIWDCSATHERRQDLIVTCIAALSTGGLASASVTLPDTVDEARLVLNCNRDGLAGTPLDSYVFQLRRTWP